MKVRNWEYVNGTKIENEAIGQNSESRNGYTHVSQGDTSAQWRKVDLFSKLWCQLNVHIYKINQEMYFNHVKNQIQNVKKHSNKAFWDKKWEYQCWLGLSKALKRYKKKKKEETMYQNKI